MRPSASGIHFQMRRAAILLGSTGVVTRASLLRSARHVLVAVVAITSYGASTLAFGLGDPARGARAFQACMACHSTKAGEHMTGPSLASVWQHKAGTVAGFYRYSEAMKHVELEWTEESLD